MTRAEKQTLGIQESYEVSDRDADQKVVLGLQRLDFLLDAIQVDQVHLYKLGVVEQLDRIRVFRVVAVYFDKRDVINLVSSRHWISRGRPAGRFEY